MNISFLIAQVLLLLAVVAHAWAGDRDLHSLRPDASDPALEQWLQARAGWHLVSWDLLLAAIGVSLLTWTDVLAAHRAVYSHLLVVYFVGAGAAWLLTLVGTPGVAGRWWRLGQWGLLWVIAGLIWWGS